MARYGATWRDIVPLAGDLGHTVPVHPELSSLSSTVAATKSRVTTLVETLHADRDAELAALLYEIERSLGSVQRQLDRATRLARSG